MRTIIELREEQLEALDGICRRESISRAEAIRRAVDLLVRNRAAGASRAAFGLWRRSRPGAATPARSAVDGLAYQDRLRSEWGTSAAAAPTSTVRVGRKRGR